MSGIAGKLHLYTPNLQAFEFAKESNDNSSPKNCVVFIGGMTDSLLTTPYVTQLAKSLSDEWLLVQPALSSSGSGWATSSLDKDVDELKQLVKYLREQLNIVKIVLFGHSTGSQDSIHYALKAGDIDGIILQGSVSDREVTEKIFKDQNLDLDEFNKEAKEILDTKGPSVILPQKFIEMFFGTPVTPYRWLSLCSKGGDDDYFSSDLSDEQLKKTFGNLRTPICILFGGSDECVPDHVDRKLLFQRWKDNTPEEYWSNYSTIVEGATHRLGEEAEPGALDEVLKLANLFINDL